MTKPILKRSSVRITKGKTQKKHIHHEYTMAWKDEKEDYNDKESYRRIVGLLLILNISLLGITLTGLIDAVLVVFMVSVIYGFFVFPSLFRIKKNRITVTEDVKK